MSRTETGPREGEQRQETVVELESLTKRFRDVTAVDDIDLSIADGEFLTLLGPSGCGKTTTLRMIAGFETPSEGVVRIDGDTVTKTPPYNRDTGMVFQQYALFPHMSVADNIAFGLEMDGVPDAEITERVRDALAMVRLEGLGDRYPEELSGGQQQRVALARALVIEPSVLLLDEPLSNLDKKLREEMRLEILRLHRELDVTMVYVTHNQEEALTMSDRMAVMNSGKIHQVGTPREVYHRPTDSFVADFIGNANLLDGEVTAQADGQLTVSLDAGSDVTVDEDAATARKVQTGERVTLLFRPERFRVYPGDADVDAENTITGTVEEVTFLGSRIDYYVRVGDTRLHVVQQNLEEGETFEENDEVTMGFRTDSPFLIPETGGES
jgi:spermidine/putrescine ABC transporter ATP-binding subunit